MSEQEPTNESPRHEAPRQHRSIVTLAVLGLNGVAVGAVVGLVYDVVVHSADASALVSVASIAVGALASIAGGAVMAKAPR